jgi:hypothetical protein
MNFFLTIPRAPIKGIEWIYLFLLSSCLLREILQSLTLAGSD